MNSRFRSGAVISTQRRTTIANRDRPNPFQIEEVLNYCKRCEGPGCRYYVCACRGNRGVICWTCLEKIIIKGNPNRPGHTKFNTCCPDCRRRFVGIDIVKGPTLAQLCGMGTKTLLFCIFAPIVIFGAIFVLLGKTKGWSTNWLNIFGGTLLFIYIFEGLVYSYCLLYYRQNTHETRIRLNRNAIRIRTPEEVRQVAAKLHKFVSNINVN